jgi:signal transduction histidine kinase
MSPVIEQMLNLPVSEMLAMSIDQLLERIHPDDRGTVAAELKRSGSVGIGNVIYRFMAVDGSYRWLSNRFTVIRAADGRVLSSGVVRDVTESMQYNEALRKANEKLERSNEELQELAYVASHDLQEPLRTASFFADLLARDASCNLDERGREHLRLILDGTARMRELIDDLPESSRVGTAGQSFAPVDMNEVADRALRVLRSSIAESGVEIVVNELPTVNGDRAQLIHLMQNLLSNAVKFHSERPPRVEISSRNVDGEIVFSVRDNGIGIDMKHADRLFKMFSRLHTRDEYPGTGMGLAIAKRIVERHGGAYGSRACRARARRSTSPFHHEPARQARREGDVAAISLHIADRPTR